MRKIATKIARVVYTDIKVPNVSLVASVLTFDNHAVELFKNSVILFLHICEIGFMLFR